MMTLDVSLGSEVLYRGLEVEVLAGQPTLLMPRDEAIRRILENLEAMPIVPKGVVLTGGMAIWSYLAIFHHLHGRTKRIWYEDGRGQRVLEAAHG